MPLDDPLGKDAPLVEFAGVAMPDEIIAKINRYLPLPAQIAFSRASKGTHYGINRYGVFQDRINKANQEAQLLKWHVLHGNEDAALRLLEEKPYLFFIETAAVAEYAKDYKGNARMFTGSAFQAALAMGYTQLLNSEIVQEIIKSNPKTVGCQIEKQFPKGFDFPLENEAAIDRAFANFVSAFERDKFPGGYGRTATLVATAKFRDTFVLTAVNQGWLFDLRILVKATDVLNANWNKWNTHQRDWFSCQIYGYLQTLVSAFDAQVIREGIENVTKDDKISVVPSSLTLKDGNFYYAVRPKQTRGVGIDSYVGIYGRTATAGGGVCIQLAGTLVRRAFKSYIKQKQQSLDDLTCGNTNRPVHTR